MSFKYPHTCGDIDTVATDIKALIEEMLEEAMTGTLELNLTPQEQLNELMRHNEHEFNKLIDRFRDINAEMRCAAEQQVEEALEKEP